MNTTDNLLRVGTSLNHGKYRIVRHLASGGFGNTYEAFNTVFDAKCAIKEFFMSGVNHRAGDSLAVEVSNSAMTYTFDSAKKKFKKEAQRLYGIQNEHIVRVHDMFEENNTVYYVMDFIDGSSLNKIMKQQGHPFSEAQCKDILLQMCDALRCIHAQKLWHMDIKPGNIMMDGNGKCTLIDFGASKQTDPDGHLTIPSSTVAYTPAFAPSEQIFGNKDKWGPWTDIYALGATVYNLLTKKTPPLRDDIEIFGDKAFSFSPMLSKQICSLVMHMMQPLYIKRPQSVEEVEAKINANKGPALPPISPTSSDGISTIYVSEEKLDSENRTFQVNGVKFTMVLVPGGTFTMGATSELAIDAYDDNEKPTHQVTLSSFSIGQTEVTQELWQAVMGNNPSYFKGPKRPVERVSWNDCQSFIRKLNGLTGQNFRLPTEAEWEYAARGGRNGGTKYAGSDNLNDVAWYWKNSGYKYLNGSDSVWNWKIIRKNYSQTHDVATKRANALGIYDMLGNVWEWCQDWYGSYSSSSQTNPQGPSSGSFRVFRGGSWYNCARDCRVSSRTCFTPVSCIYGLGLRLAL